MKILEQLAVFEKYGIEFIVYKGNRSHRRSLCSEKKNPEDIYEI